MSDLSKPKIKIDSTLELILRNPLIKQAAQLQVLAVKERQHREREIVEGKAYKVITKRTTCEHCASVVDVDIRLSPKEYITFVSPKGKVVTLHFKMLDDRHLVLASSTTCPNCIDFVSKMDRKELEARYLRILATSNTRKFILMGEDIHDAPKELDHKPYEPPQQVREE